MLGKKFSRYFETFCFISPRKWNFDVSCKLSPKETFCMKCQILLYGKYKKTKKKNSLWPADGTDKG